MFYDTQISPLKHFAIKHLIVLHHQRWAFLNPTKRNISLIIFSFFTILIMLNFNIESNKVKNLHSLVLIETMQVSFLINITYWNLLFDLMPVRYRNSFQQEPNCYQIEKRAMVFKIGHCNSYDLNSLMEMQLFSSLFCVDMRRRLGLMHTEPFSWWKLSRINNEWKRGRADEILNPF